MLTAAGFDTTTLPTTQDDAWTWEEFADVAAQLRASLPADKYPFVYNWQLGGAPRWLSWLFQADGSFLDGTTATIDSAAGEKALDFTKSFFENEWVPPTSSTKATTYADSLFAEQTTAMAFIGSFLVPDMDYFNEFEWTSVPDAPRRAWRDRPRRQRARGDRGDDKPALSAEFLKFMVSADAMSAFCAATNELPTRVDLSGDAIEFVVRPDVMPVFVEQATTIEPSDVKQLTSPAMAAINTALQDQLEAAFVGGQSTADTLANLSQAIEEAAQ